MKLIAIGLSIALSVTFIRFADATELVHYKFDQVDGSAPDPLTTPDSSGRGNTGTLMNADNTIVMPGRIGNAFQFNGGAGATADRVQLPSDHVDFNRTYTEFTFAAWLKPVEVVSESSATNWIAGKMGAGGNRGWQIGLTGTSPASNPHEMLFGYFDGPGGMEQEVFLGPNAALANDTWMHFAVVFRANDSVRLYVNGDLMVDDPGALSAMNGVNNAAFQVGNRGNNIALSWDGLLDEVYVFDHALTDAEIEALAAPTMPGGGDHNGDGVVDAADYVVWRKTQINGQQGYDDWRTNFGGAAGSSSAFGQLQTIPEPTAALIAVTAFGGVLLFRRVRPRHQR
jgi:Concanavalin A-like lectin/glucanases superfamily